MNGRKGREGLRESPHHPKALFPKSCLSHLFLLRGYATHLISASEG